MRSPLTRSGISCGISLETEWLSKQSGSEGRGTQLEGARKLPNISHILNRIGQATNPASRALAWVRRAGPCRGADQLEVAWEFWLGSQDGWKMLAIFSGSQRAGRRGNSPLTTSGNPLSQHACAEDTLQTVAMPYIYQPEQKAGIHVSR